MDHAHAPSPSSDPHHGASATSGHHGGLSYYAVFFILLVVTIAEVGVAYLPLPHGVKILTFIVMALYKAVMVALYFMHLKFENKIMWVIAAAPLIFGVLITIGTYPDSEKGTERFKNGELQPWSPPTNVEAPAAGHSNH